MYKAARSSHLDRNKLVLNALERALLKCSPLLDSHENRIDTRIQKAVDQLCLHFEEPYTREKPAARCIKG